MKDFFSVDNKLPAESVLLLFDVLLLLLFYSEDWRMSVKKKNVYQKKLRNTGAVKWGFKNMFIDSWVCV